MEQNKNWATVIRRSDGKYFQGCGYGGPGHPVPYWTDDMKMAQVYKTPTGAAGAMKRYGGYRGAVETQDGRVVRWLGFLAYGHRGWRFIEESPREFDPNDYEGNNGPL